jgi:hypothetical protein
MKRSILAFRWFIASLLVGVVAVGVLIVSGVYLPAHTKVTSEAISRRAELTGLTIWIFLIGVPLVTLLLAVRELTTSNSSWNESADK